jgi:RNA polymerase sigma factor for flagellar operon FliA
MPKARKPKSTAPKPPALTEQELALWAAYHRADRSAETRNSLVTFYLPIVRRIANSLCKSNPHVELDDMISVGTIGMLMSIERFELSRNMQFATFASARIFGAMIDEMRNWDWVPRLVRRQASALRTAMDELTSQLGREPTDKELARKLGITREELREFLQCQDITGVTSLHHKKYETDSFKDITNVILLVDRDAPRPERNIDAAEEMRDVLRGLAKRDRLMMIGYFYEGQTMKEIAGQLGCSESRVSQRTSQLLVFVADRIGHRRREFGIRDADLGRRDNKIQNQSKSRKRAARKPVEQSTEHRAAA